jgi:hypothetical protein
MSLSAKKFGRYLNKTIALPAPGFHAATSLCRYDCTILGVLENENFEHWEDLALVARVGRRSAKPVPSFGYSGTIRNTAGSFGSRLLQGSSTP